MTQTIASSSSSTKSLLDQLNEYKLTGVHRPHHVAHLGQTLIERGYATSNSDQVWSFLEQVGTASIECGQLQLAQVCASRLSARFPDSPRVAILLGMLLEAKGESEQALTFYQEWLEKDETDVNIRKRLVSLHLYSSPASSSPSSSSAALTTKGKNLSPSSTGLSREEGIKMLVSYLDTFYNDPEAWSQLADVYAEMGLYAQALSALSHLILLAPYNPYHLLHHAETAYTLHDYPLALKEFLRVIEMSHGVSNAGGAGKRAAIGAKLCLNKLATMPNTPISDPLLKPTRTNELDLMLIKLLIESYPKGAEKDTMQQWLGAIREAK